MVAGNNLYTLFLLRDKIYHCHYYCVCLCYRKDAFTGTEYIQEGLQIEQASVLYNLCESTSLHGGYREEGRDEGREEGRDGGMKGGMKEGRKGGMKGVMKERRKGGKEGREGGR